MVSIFASRFLFRGRVLVSIVTTPLPASRQAPYTPMFFSLPWGMMATTRSVYFLDHYHGLPELVRVEGF